MISRKEIINIIRISTELGILALAITRAFSINSRETIWARDGGVCQMSGKTSQEATLYCAHWDHRRNDNYDDPSNGRLLTLPEHYKDHFYSSLDDLGLTFEGNLWALRKMWKKLTNEERRGLPHPLMYKVRATSLHRDRVPG